MAHSQTESNKNAEKQRHDLKEGSLGIKLLSALIDQSLERAQEWFAGLDGRVETEVSIDDPFPDPDLEQYGDQVFELRLSRPKWLLEGRFSLVGALENRSDEWEPVLTGNMEMKMAALHALPALYAGMQDSQSTYLEQLRQAINKYEDFARAIGLRKGEGE